MRVRVAVCEGRDTEGRIGYFANESLDEDVERLEEPALRLPCYMTITA